MSTLGLNGVVRQFTHAVRQTETSMAMIGIKICAAVEVPTENGRAALDFEAPGRDAASLRVLCPNGEHRARRAPP